MSEIEACRTCGIFFLVTSNYLRHLFESEPEMQHVRRELENWSVKLNQNDCFPQYICTVCLLEFRKILKFKHACLETQEQLRQLYAMQQENINKIQIKTEVCDDIVIKKEPEYKSPDTDDHNVCAFIYIDDLSDSEYDNEAECTNVPQFKVPHIPIKEEIIEEARVPLEAVTEQCNEEIPKDEQLSLPPQLTAETVQEIENTFATSAENESSEIESGIHCELCLHVSVDQQEHRQHLLRIHESKPLECHICGKQFKAGTTQTRLKYHLKWHRLNKHVKCSQCGFHCASRDVLNEHTRAVHTKTPCKICGKRFLPKKLRLHMDEHQLEEKAMQRIECPYCIGVFANEIERDQHILLTHSEETPENTDDNSLDQDFHQSEETSKDSLMESGSETETSSTATSSTTMSFSPDDGTESRMPHFMTDTENNDYELETIDPYETTLESEMSTVNLTAPVLEEMQFACAQCPISFAKVEQLIAHAEVHQEKANFCCNVCGKKFDLKFSLNRHMKRHKNMTY